jgi:murein DD-endopeptidase MepM/ murein hydrolase activator NlpD
MRSWAILIIGLSIGLVSAVPALAQGDSSGQTTIHIVQRGETLYRIALTYGTSVEAIAQTNGLSDSTNIQVGQRLIIPSSLVNATIPTAGRHVVQPGESLAHIALRYGSTTDIVARLNSIVNPTRIFVGESLDVSETTPGHPPLSHGYTHTVTTGENLFRIALSYHVDLADILRANGLTTPLLLYPGQHLLIPGSETAPALQMLPAPLTEMLLSPLPAEVGRTLSIQVKSTQPVTISGTFIDRPLHFAPESDGITYTALYGVHAFTVPAIYPLALTVTDAAGNASTFTTDVRVADGGYKSEAITVPEDQLALLDPALNTAEFEFIASLMTGFTPEKYFDGPMGLPAAAPVTSPFGTRRSYNGSAYDRFHTGTDFGAPPASPIYAPASGVVTYVGTLDIHGLFTVIDHGRGVYSAYAHQSESYVQPGQFVHAGDIIGAVGNSGRSIGPHLHWELWVNGVETDALQWARIGFP